MAIDKKISQLVQATSMVAADQFTILQSGVNKRITRPNMLAANRFRWLSAKAIKDDEALTVADGKARLTLPALWSGNFYLVDTDIHVYTTSSSGKPTVQLHNQTAAVDMLSTKLTVDAGELDSKDAAIPPVVDTTKNTVSEGTVIRIDVDVAGTGAEGLEVRMKFAEAQL